MTFMLLPSSRRPSSSWRDDPFLLREASLGDIFPPKMFVSTSSFYSCDRSFTPREKKGENEICTQVRKKKGKNPGKNVVVQLPD